MSARVLEHRQDEGWVHSSATPSHAVPLAALTDHKTAPVASLLPPLYLKGLRFRPLVLLI